MKIIAIETSRKDFNLTRPYKIFNKTFDKVENCIVKIKLENGIVGLGVAAPGNSISNETTEDCEKALAPDNLTGLLNKSIYQLPAHCRYLEQALPTTPAARAAVDIALHDAYAQLCKLPLVEILGRAQDALPTSITIGIKSIEDSIIEAKEYASRGFKIFKIKLGKNVEKDVEMVHRLKEAVPKDIKLRVDANQGYKLIELLQFMQQTEKLQIELIEQPLSVENFHQLQHLSNPFKARIAADESIQNMTDAFHLIQPKSLCGIFNIKLMKCGGIYGAKKIAEIANLADIDLMWGCMDESIISIAAALHVALSYQHTKYLDLDGSLDLANDVVTDGFILKDGVMRLTDKPGLGVTPIDE